MVVVVAVAVAVMVVARSVAIPLAQKCPLVLKRVAIALLGCLVAWLLGCLFHWLFGLLGCLC